MKNFLFLAVLLFIASCKPGKNTPGVLVNNLTTQEYLQKNEGNNFKIKLDKNRGIELKLVETDIYTPPCIEHVPSQLNTRDVEAKVVQYSCQILPGTWYMTYCWYFTGITGNNVRYDQQWKNFPILVKEDHPENECFYGKVVQIKDHPNSNPIWVLVEI